MYYYYYYYYFFFFSKFALRYLIRYQKELKPKYDRCASLERLSIPLNTPTNLRHAFRIATHYENTPIQIYRKFSLQKLKISR